ncbi:MAG: GGDEF domain-containing response regulator [Nitrospiraceae bacterium]|nr:MAG: GGDEF domain-containing response regulator [Nitrospiraceae bacterium]
MLARTPDKSIDVLLADNDPGFVRTFRDSMKCVAPEKFDLTRVGKLADTIKCLRKERYDIVMLDPNLPDSEGFDTFISVRMHAPEVPVILLSRIYDEELAVRAVQNGAQDVLIKGQLDGVSLMRSMRYAIERHRLLADLEQEREKERRLAHFDALTGLPNRLLFLDRLDLAIAHARRYNEKLAVMFIDLDGFKAVNDLLGHDFGDALLCAVGRRLKDCLRKSDTVARMGGDEFTCILPLIRKPKDAAVVGQKIIRSLAGPFDVKGRRICISGSIGASIFPDDAADSGTLLRNADMAMYGVKKNGKNSLRFYSAEMNDCSPGAGEPGGRRCAAKTLTALHPGRTAAGRTQL